MWGGYGTKVMGGGKLEGGSWKGGSLNGALGEFRVGRRYGHYDTQARFSGLIRGLQIR